MKKIIIIMSAFVLLLSACNVAKNDEKPGAPSGVPGNSELVDDGVGNSFVDTENGEKENQDQEEAVSSTPTKEPEQQQEDKLGEELTPDGTVEGAMEIKNADIAEAIATVLGKSGPFFMEEELQQVTKLYVSNMVSGDISELSLLQNLVFLNVSNTEIISVDSISELSDLEYLYLDNTGLDSFEFVQSLPNLRVLSLCNNKLTDLEGIDMLFCLEELYVSGNKIENVWQYEEFCDCLLYCDIDFTEGQNGSVLFADEAMEEIVRDFIDNYTNPITESQLEEVVVLVVSDSDVCSVEDLVRCPNLFSLTLWNTGVTNYFPIMEMTSLEELVIQTEEEIDAAMFMMHPSLIRVVINGEETVIE